MQLIASGRRVEAIYAVGRLVRVYERLENERIAQSIGD